MASVVFFGPARDAAGTRRLEVEGASVGEIVEKVLDRFGPPLAALMPTCRVWVNGHAAFAETALSPGDEVAVLPPVSGG